MRLTVQLRGVDTISLRTKALIAAAQYGMKAGVAEAALILEQEAKSLVPVDTGNLRDNIHSELIESTELRQVVAVTPVWEEGEGSAYESSQMHLFSYEVHRDYGFQPAYARRIEYGFVGADVLGRRYNQPPQPYMRPAFDMRQGDARQAIADSIYSELDAVKR